MITFEQFKAEVRAGLVQKRRDDWHFVDWSNDTLTIFYRANMLDGGIEVVYYREGAHWAISLAHMHTTINERASTLAKAVEQFERRLQDVRSYITGALAQIILNRESCDP